MAAAVDLAANSRAELAALGVAEVPEVVGLVDEVDEIRQGTEAHFRQPCEAAVNFGRSRGVALRSVVLRGHAAAIFAFESVALWQRGEWALSLANLAGSVLASCAAVVLLVVRGQCLHPQ